MDKTKIRGTRDAGRGTKFSWFLILIIIYVFSSLVLLPSSFVEAAVPHLINYQGRLTDKDGKPLQGTYNITFKIYDAENGGGTMTPWEENHPTLEVAKGVFSVMLGSFANLNLAFDKPYFLEIVVNNEVMSPRQRLTSSGYAIRSEKSDSAESLPAGVLLICKDSCPVGYRRLSALDGKFLVGGSGYNPNAGGSNTHTHSYSGVTNNNTAWKRQDVGHAPDYNSPETFHDHAYSGTANSADSRPEFATVIICEKE